MENSDSDTENECFESAEESIDEEEKIEITKSKTSLTEGGSESPELVGSNCDTASPVPPLNADVTGNLMSYRKRPERVKRLHSRPSSNTVTKSTDELIFKADKIVSDVFLQEVTSNLSKNINRSLSTLQQTSCNVKDLIFNSLPVSSLSDKEGFSYDDRNLLSTSANTSQDKDFECTGDNVKKKAEVDAEKISTKELNFVMVDGQSGDVKDKKLLDITDELGNTLNNREKCHNLNVTVSVGAVEKEFDSEKDQILKNHDSVCLDPSFLSSNEHSDAVENSVGSIKCDDSRNSEVLGPNDQDIAVQEEEISLSNTNTCLQDKNLDNCNLQINKNDSKESELNEEENKETEKIVKDDIISHEIIKVSSNQCNNLISSLENTDSSGSLIIEAGEDISNRSEEKLATDSECNVKELKMALKNIITDEKNDVEDVNENSKESFTKEELIFEGKLMENQSFESSKEGWDDFDFSDIEEENIGFKKNNIEGVAVIKKENLTSKSANCVSNKENPKIDSTKSCTHETFEKDLFSRREGLINDRESGNNEIIEIKPVAEDSWDWDAWDEVTEDSRETASLTKTENLNCEKSDEASDARKWSGWEKFGEKSEEKAGNWGLGSWGVDMLLNKATAVTQGISNVLEAGLGAPDPETLARMEKIEQESLKQHLKDGNENEGGEEPLVTSKKNSISSSVSLFPVSGITSLVAGVTSKIVEHSKIQEIGSKVITGGLDTLETFGKKTMEVLQEGDPGLKNKRAFLLNDKKPVLSQVLREAREKADKELKKVEERELARKCHFETLFDDFQGMVHLEALEMLSRQYELKLEQLRMNSETPEDFDETLKEVEELCSLYENDEFLKTSSKLDFKIKLQMAVKPLVHEISIQRIIQIQEEVCNWLQTSSERKPSLNTINQKLISTLAELSAAAVQVFHKSGELLSIKECRETVEEVDALLRLTDVLCTEINGLYEKFILLFKDKINDEASEEKVTTMSENAATVMTNSVSYIRQAFNLLIPVLQFGAAVY